MINKKIAIIDYGLGNIFSLHKALKLYSNNIVVADNQKDISLSDAVIIPGVGAFAAGMEGLINRNLVDALISFANSGRPMLGICLGAQLLLSKGFEFGEHDGLNIIPGKVQIFSKEVAQKEKIPHIGWNSINAPLVTKWDDTIFSSINSQANVYFVHSYVMMPEYTENILSLTEYGDTEFCSTIKKGNIYGTQFHPEKSGEVGLAIIKNFININKK